MKLKKVQFFLTTLCLIFISTLEIAAQQAQVEMADEFRSNGKIYVVIAVLLCIFAFLFFHLIVLDKRIRKVEEEVKSS